MALVTLQDIINDTLLRLNEAANSPLGSLPSGTGAAATLATADMITRLTNECIGDLCRSGGLAIPDTGGRAATPGAVFVSYASLALASGNTLWLARDVSFAAGRLVFIGPGQFAQKYSLSGAVATPKEWSRVGTEGFSLGPSPSTGGMIAAAGLAIPPPLVSAGDPISPFLPVDLRRYISYWNAYYLAVKNKEDATLLAAAPGWKAEYETGKGMQLGRLARMDPALYTAYYAPLVIGAKSK